LCHDQGAITTSQYYQQNLAVLWGWTVGSMGREGVRLPLVAIPVVVQIVSSQYFLSYQ
jgi:hypothetical protein